MDAVRGLAKRHRARSLRIEPLEVRQLLATASVANSLVTYTAAAGETNDIVLSPGKVFSIQDAPDVQQHGEDGFKASDFLSALGYSIDLSIGFGVGSDVLTASSKATSLSGLGFSIQVSGAQHVAIDGGSGGSDSASLTGSSSADVFFASLTSASPAVMCSAPGSTFPEPRTSFTPSRPTT